MYEGQSNENLKYLYIFKYILLRFSFVSPSYYTSTPVLFKKLRSLKHKKVTLLFKQHDLLISSVTKYIPDTV